MQFKPSTERTNIMEIVLERHKYAPELNVAYVGPTRAKVKAPGCTSIRQVREKLFSPLQSTGRHVVVASVYPESHAWLDRKVSGMCNDLGKLAQVLKDLRSKLAPGLGAVVKVSSSRLIGSKISKVSPKRLK